MKSFTALVLVVAASISFGTVGVPQTAVAQQSQNECPEGTTWTIVFLCDRVTLKCREVASGCM